MAAQRRSTNLQGVTGPPPLGKDVKVMPGAMVLAECEIIGDVTIGSRTIIHPKARIIAEAGPIIIGENNLIEEQSTIINKFPQDKEKPTNTQSVMIIGNNNVFEVDSYCEALKVGDNNVVEVKARVGRAITLTNGCIVGSRCELDGCEVLSENTALTGQGGTRRKLTERPLPQTLQMDFLFKILPNYHHVRKPTTK